jgi:hypothetical protein
MLTLITLTQLLIILSHGCVVGTPAIGCNVSDINNTLGSPNQCYCLACDTNLRRAGDKNTCCNMNISNCLTCDSLFNCTACVTYYGFNGSTCAKCDTNFPYCISCTSIDAVCTGCLTTFALIAQFAFLAIFSCLIVVCALQARLPVSNAIQLFMLLTLV